MGTLFMQNLPLLGFTALAFVGGIMLNVQIYKMTLIDAKARGMKYPRFWGIFNMGGNNGSANVLLYLIRRRKYPVLQMSEEENLEIEKRKKNAGVALLFLVVGILGFLFIFLGGPELLL